MRRPGKSNDKNLQMAWWVCLAIVLVVTVAVRIRLLGIPLERDEGEYAYAGQLMLQGIPPYQLVYNMKFPGTYAAYALMMSIFGQSIAGVHLGLLVVNMATVALVFLVGRRLMNATAGIAAAASYAILSLSPSVLGFEGHATHFVVFPVLGGVLLLLGKSGPVPVKIVLASGVLFGLALLMKQPALFFIPFGAGYLLYCDWRARLPLKKILLRSLIFICGAGLPLGVTCIWLWWAGVLAKFWFFTFAYAREYGGIVSLSDGIQEFKETIKDVLSSGWIFWVLAAFGLIGCLWDKTVRLRAPFLLGFLAFSGLAVCPGLYFRPHYFILALPAICLLAGAAVVSMKNLFTERFRRFRFVPLILFGVGSILAFWGARGFYFAPNPVAVTPFPEAVRIAEYLREHTTANDTVAVLGSEPEIYFYSQRHSATGYVYTYALMEPHKYALQMQREMIREIEAARPKYIVFVKLNLSWLSRAESETLIFDWFAQYSAENLKLTGLANMVSATRTDYYLPLLVAPETITLSRYHILIYERKS